MPHPTVLPLVAILAFAALGGAQRYPAGHLLIEPAELEARLGEEDLLVVDMRDAGAHARAHVPGAVRLGISAIATTVDGIPFEADREALVDVLRGIGLAPGDEVAIYDDLGMMNAARLFWTLELAGHERVRILHGGWDAWLAEGRPTSDAPVEPEPSGYEPRWREARLVTAEELAERLDDPGLAILDARSRAEYTGEIALAERGGHVPGAVSLPWLDTLAGGDAVATTEPGWQAELRDPDVERFRPPRELAALLEVRGLVPEREVVTYCHTLWRGAHAYFLLRLMGFDDVRGYDGSWVEWAARPELPVVRGPHPDAGAPGSR